MKSRLFKGKSKRTKIFTAISLASLLVLLGLNLLLSYFGLQRTLFFDMTKEKLYSLSDTMEKECDELFTEIKGKADGKKIRVTFCTDPDYLMASSSTAITYVMALKLQNRYPDLFEVKTVNVAMNPTAVSQYKTTSLSVISPTNIIVSYGDRYRISTLDYFWMDGTLGNSYYNGEYRMVTYMKSVTAIGQPKAYFITDHGESYYDPKNPASDMSVKNEAFAALLADRGLEVATLSLSSVDEIPEDCALLIINNPQKDFTYDPERLDELAYVTDLEKIDKYLVMRQGALVVAKDFAISLPVFESFLYEWGFEFSESVLVDRESCLEDEKNSGTNIIAHYDTDTNSYGYALYGEYADLTSAPLTIFSNAGSVGCSYNESSSRSEAGSAYASRTYAPYLTTSSSAKRYMTDENGNITTVVDGDVGTYELAALSIRSEKNSFDDTNVYSYVFAVNSADFFTNELLSEASYANYDIVSAVIENITKIDDYASSSLGGHSLNSPDGGGKMIISTAMSEDDVKLVYPNKYQKLPDGTELGVIKENYGISGAAKITYTCIIMAVPVALAVVGTVICVKRRHL